MGVLFVLAVGYLLYLAEPHVVVSEVRTTGNLETIRGLYGRACGEDFISELREDQDLGRLSQDSPLIGSLSEAVVDVGRQDAASFFEPHAEHRR